MSEQEHDESQPQGESQAPDDIQSQETPDPQPAAAPAHDTGQDQPAPASQVPAPPAAEAPAQPAPNLPLVEPTYSDESLNEYVRDSLQPVSPEHPCGQDEDEASSVVSQIETTADAIHESLRLSFGEAVRDENTEFFDIASTGADAEELVGQIVECLKEKCKSLVLASYLPHLLLITRGFEGFDAGLMIFREIVERFPEQRFPRDDERLSSFLRRGVYVGNDDKVTDNFKLFLYQPITEHSRLPYALLRNAKLRGSGEEIEGKYSTDAAKSSPEFYDGLIGKLNAAIESSRSANKAIGGHLGDTLFEIVSFSFIESLERMSAIITQLATDHCDGYPIVHKVEVEDEGVEGGAKAAPGTLSTAGEIASRDQAIELLRKVADFFHRTERHSPISYRIRETIRWCNLDLPELMQILLDGDTGPLNEMHKRVGFLHKEDESKSESPE